MSLQTVETLLGLEDDERVTTLYAMYEAQLLARLDRLKPDREKPEDEPDEVPVELEYIVAELTIARFNRIGSEGMVKESMDGHSAEYQDMSLDDYDAAINAYLNPESSPKLGVVRFL